MVYEAILDAQDSSAPDINLPPLVAKISFRGRTTPAAHEAYYYETLQPLQGVSIARFYGRFVSDVPLEISLVHSKKPNGSRSTKMIDLTP